MRPPDKTIWLSVSADPVAETINLGSEYAGQKVSVVFPDSVRVYERETGDLSNVHVQLSPRVTEIINGQELTLDANGSITIEIEMREAANAVLDVKHQRRTVQRLALHGLDSLRAKLHSGVRTVPRTIHGAPIWLKLTCEPSLMRLDFPVSIVALSHNLVLSYVSSTKTAQKKLELQAVDGLIGPFHVRLMDRQDASESVYVIIHPVSHNLCPVHLALPIAPAKAARAVTLPTTDEPPPDDPDTDELEELPAAAVAQLDTVEEPTIQRPPLLPPVKEDAYHPLPTPTASTTLANILGEQSREFTIEELPVRRLWRWSAIPLLMVATLLAGALLHHRAPGELPEPTRHMGIMPRFDEGRMGPDPCSRVDPAVLCDSYKVVTQQGVQQLQFGACRGLGGVNACECDIERNANGVEYQVFTCRSH